MMASRPAGATATKTDIRQSSRESKIRCRAIGAASDLMKAMSNPVRLSILCVLVEGARSVAELENILDVHQPTLSQQLGELRTAGIIVGHRAAKAVVYRLSDVHVAQLIGHLRLLFPDPQASAIWRGATLSHERFSVSMGQGQRLLLTVL